MSSALTQSSSRLLRWSVPAVFTLCALAAWPVAAMPDDTDGDTISDIDEGKAQMRDTDLDGIPDYLDDDSDGDGIADSIEAADSDVTTPPLDTDADGLPNFIDVDSDNDGLPDAVEDPDGDGMVSPDETDPLNPDTDGDGLTDGQEDPNKNGQHDPGEPNPRSSDTDGDGIRDGRDLCPVMAEDLDGLTDDDGCPETDADADGIPDTVERGHRCLLALVQDVDGDGLIDGNEDVNANGIVDPGETDPCDEDTDDDTFLDGVDPCPLEAEDRTDDVFRDGCPGGLGDAGPDLPDTDGDGIVDKIENATCTDPLVADTDGDGRDDGDEDTNRNGAIDEGETDPCTSNIRPIGGAGCHMGGSIPLIGLFVLFVASLVRRLSPTLERRGP